MAGEFPNRKRTRSFAACYFLPQHIDFLFVSLISTVITFGHFSPLVHSNIKKKIIFVANPNVVILFLNLSADIISVVFLFLLESWLPQCTCIPVFLCLQKPLLQFLLHRLLLSIQPFLQYFGLTHPGRYVMCRQERKNYRITERSYRRKLQKEAIITPAAGCADRSRPLLLAPFRSNLS